MTIEVERVRHGSDSLASLSALVEDYRAHYGQDRDPGRAHAWLRGNLARELIHGYVARDAGRPTGMALAVPSPATLRLAHFWSLRDLYVLADARRTGVGTALIDAVAADARADGAIRLALQTEQDNDAALALYRGYGFEPVEAMQALLLEL